MNQRAEPVALITGSRKGIGRHLAGHFMSRGYAVHGCSRQPADLDDPRYTHHALDVVEERAVRDMVGEIRRRHGRLDVLIANAGIASMNALLTMPADTMRRLVEVNIAGTALVCREAAKVMVKRRHGRIVAIGSIAAPLHLAGEAIYAASKSAIVTLMRALAYELADYGITCNVVGPTPIETDLTRGVPPEKIQALIDRQAIRRPGRFTDVTNVVDFFVRPESDYVTGQVVYLGGITP